MQLLTIHKRSKIAGDSLVQQIKLFNSYISPIFPTDKSLGGIGSMEMSSRNDDFKIMKRNIMREFCCESNQISQNIKVVSISAAEAIGEIAEAVPEIGIGEIPCLNKSDVYIHRFVDDVNNVPLNYLKMVSFVKATPTADWAERHFIGTIAEQRFKYSMTVKRQNNLLDVSLAFREPSIAQLPYVSLTIDPKKGIINSTVPNILELTEQPSSHLDPISAMVHLAHYTFAEAEYDKKCLFIALGFTALSCAPTLLAGGPAGLAFFMICAGPAAVAALVGCKSVKSRSLSDLISNEKS